MTSVDILDAKGKKSGTADLPADIFDVQANVPLIHQVVVAQLAAARQGTASAKTRGEVRGGGKKPYRQKGTGRARQGSTRAPQFAGGGVVHGPVPRDYSQRTPKKMKAAALRGALSDRARGGRVHVVSGFVSGDAPSTASALAVLDQLADSRNVLVVLPRNDDVTWKSLRNVPSVHLLHPDQLNTYDVLVSDDIVFTEQALETFVAGPATGRSVTASASSAEVVEDVIVTDEPVQDEAAEDAVAPVQFAGSLRTEASADAPDDEHQIKGNEDSMKFHVPGSRWYDATIAEVWFATAEEAEAAGFEPAGGAAAQQVADDASEEDAK